MFEISLSLVLHTQCNKVKFLIKFQTGAGNGNPLQYPCLENTVDRGAWQSTVNGSQQVRYNLVTK